MRLLENISQKSYILLKEIVEDKIFNLTSAAIADKHLNLDAILIRDVTLLPTLQTAIENTQEQEALEYEFKTKEEKEQNVSV